MPAWLVAAGVRGTFAVDEEVPVDLPLSSLLFIVIASYVSLSTLFLQKFIITRGEVLRQELS